MTLKDALWENRFIQNIYWKFQPARLLYNISPELALKILYRVCCGKKLNLKNPSTFDEKIQWLKIYDSTPLKTQLADKYLVKEWVSERIGEEYIIPTLGVWDSFDKIDFDSLPNQFVLKANHGSAMNIIVTDKSKLDYADAKRKFDVWLKRNLGYHSLELHYIPIKPCIIAEQYLENSNGELTDYKCHCINGSVAYIQCMTGRASHETLREKVYDTNWNPLPFTQNYPRYDGEIRKPGNLSQMVACAETLSSEFCYVRVDFYALDDGSFKFGEMTFAPGSGYGPWNIEEYNEKIGSLIKLPIANKQTRK